MPDHKQEQGAPRSGWAAQAGAFLAVAFLAAGVCGALQPATGIPPEVLQLTQLGPALAVAAVALLWPGRTRDHLAGTLPARSSGPAGHKGETPAGGSGPAGHEGRTPARGSGPAGYEGETLACGGGPAGREGRMPAGGGGLVGYEGETLACGGGPAGREGRMPACGSGPAGHEGRTPARGSGLADREGRTPAGGSGRAGYEGETLARGSGPAGHKGRTPARGGGPAGHEGRTPARGSGPVGYEGETLARGSGLARREARIPVGRRAALLLTPVLITALCAGGALFTSGSLPVTSPQALAHPLALLVTAQLLGACAEEIGWRCYLQPLLRTRFGPVTASFLVGTAWGLWHVPVLAQAPAYAAGFLAATIAMSVILGLALERVRSNRLLLAGGFHTLVNLGMLFVTDETSPATAPMVVFGAACLAAAIPWAVSARRAQAAPDRITAATAHGPR
ncbi:type II CAAX prenyl endopeptidase Rce1 family protein [Streptomyces sp. NPDC090045]|uniref:CPBP family glutamic-type intramembrane protease n=1 Tax=Streptomyces sp. NPDC090045 TaxID=3365927 RepID=UPI00380A11D4